MTQIISNSDNRVYQKNDAASASVEAALPLEALAGKTVLLSGATGMIGKCMIDLLMQYNHNHMEGEPIRIVALSRNRQSAEKRLA